MYYLHMIMNNKNHQSYTYDVHNISVIQCNYNNYYWSTMHNECMLIQFQVMKFKQKYIRVVKFRSIFLQGKDTFL